MAKGKKKKKGRGKRPAPSKPVASGKPKPVEVTDPADPSPDPSTSPTREKPLSKEKQRRAILDQRKAVARRKRRIRNIAIAVVVILAIVGVVFGRQLMHRRTIAAHNELAAGAGCDPVQVHSGMTREHIEVGRAVEYDTVPPVGGPHRGSGVLPAGIQDEPLPTDPNAPQSTSIYDAVHSLEHGFVIVWHNELTEAEQTELARDFAGEHKVSVVPYPELAEHEGKRVALTAWGRSQLCEDADADVVRSFIEIYREATTAPEPDA